MSRLHSMLDLDTGRIVGAVYRGMAVRTATPHHEEGTGFPGQALVSALLVALLAEPRRFGGQHHFVVRAVWIVAIQTAFLHCRMLPQHRCLLLLVALVALVVHGIRVDQALANGAVRVVATGTFHIHLANAISARHIAQRMDGTLLDSRADLLVTRGAHFRFSLGGEQRGVIGVDAVTTRAAHVQGLVGAAQPVLQVAGVFMTTHARFGSFFSTQFCRIQDVLRFFRFGVGLAWAVAAFTRCARLAE